MSLTTEFRPITTVNGADYSAYSFPIEATNLNNWDPGNCVVLNSAGFLQECVTNAAMVMGVGITAPDTLTDESLQPCYLFDFNTIFEAAPETATLIDTQAEITALIGELADLVVSSGVHLIDLDTVDDNLFCVVGGDATTGRPRLHVTAGSDAQWVYKAAWTRVSPT